VSTALYRRYRPETFADVIGQEHVTEPLMAAIDKDRINHAYLFSGPRGCGKTTSARILARCLNCAQGPTSTPCGVCDSCVELARNGSGSLDVIEIDAASHGGVDDARDLRERATFAPVRDRFKIFIIDEAHMVTSAGFNALLKIVEEPPEHILFIFATTEPDKVIGTIRSRTHHYPFRLVPPEPLMAYLDLLCRQENVPVAPGVLSLVIRAGGGSVRDSLSVLDQLMAGAGENGLDYELAVSLLGYTHATLLDDVVDSVAAGDAATVFNAVDRVIQTGHDPRRFVEDLLERFRDLIVINAVPEGAASILRGVPDDQLNRMRTQANQLGAGELSRAADVTNTALTEMTGATSPRLHLELLCARLLLPAADATVRGTLARVDRIERRLEYAGGAPAETPPTQTSSPDAEVVPRAPARPRLDVPRNAEEAAARWSLPAADPAAPAVPAAVPGAHSPAVPAAVRTNRTAGPTADADSSPDWGGSWGVSTDSALAGAEPTKRPAAGPAGAPGQSTAPGASGAPGTETNASGAPSAEAVASGAPSAEADAGPQGPVGPRSQAQGGQGAPSPEQTPAGPAAVPVSPPRGQQPAAQQQGQQWSDTAGQQPGATPRQGEQQQEPRPPEPGQGQPAGSGGNVEMVRRAWPEILTEVAHIKRATWLIVNVAATPRSFEGNQLILAFANQGNAIGFQRGPHLDNLKQAIHKVLGLTCSIEAVHDAGGSGESGPKVPASQTDPGSNPGPDAPVPSPGRVAPQAPVGREQHPGADAGGGARAGTPTQVRQAGPDRADTEATGAAPRDIGVPNSAASARLNLAPSFEGPSSDSSRLGAPTGDGPSSGTVADRPGRTPVDAAHATTRPSGSAVARSPGADRDAARGPATPRPVTTASTTTGLTTTSLKTTGATTPETVGAWDPSLSDDTWALVEPPEEAFDPGPGWDSVTEDPDDRRPSGPRAASGHSSQNSPAHAGATKARGSRAAPPVPSAGAGAGANVSRDRQRSQEKADATTAPEPQAARSVVWSPPVAQTTPETVDSIAMPAAAEGSNTGNGSTAPRSARSAEPGSLSGSARPTGPASTNGSAVRGSVATAPDSGPEPAPHRGAPAPDRPAPADNVLQKPVSRYQQLLDEAERKRTEEAAAARGAVDLRFVEDEPSADDETIEESGLVGRAAIERILNGRLVEERSVDGQ